MAFPWTGRKDIREGGAKPEFPTALEADLPEAAVKGDNPVKSASRGPGPRVANGGQADPLPILTERLEDLGRLLEEAKEQLTSYLLHRESLSGGDDSARLLVRKVEALTERLEQCGSTSTGSSAGEGHGGTNDAALKANFRPVVEKIEQLEARLKSIDALKDALVPALTKLRDAHTEHHNTQAASFRQLAELVPQYFNALPQYFTAIQQQVMAAQQHADAGLRTIVDILRPPQPESGSSEAAVGGNWQEALLGGELAHNPALTADKNRLLGGVLNSDPAACGLLGSLLQFRAAAADKMPTLLKDIGEAFYRWQPRSSGGTSELEKALVQWLMRACEQAGMANTIELVTPGERFDSLRHNAARPGVEITQVLGWVVLRDNGKVYTKASVAVK
jgi:hypothetical protein